MSNWAKEKAKDTKPSNKDTPTLQEHENEVKQELTKLQKEFRERNEQEQKRFKDVCDSNYYFTVCFQNREQLNEFCDMVGLDSEELYFDGREFAKKIGRILKSPDSEFPKTQAFSKDWTNRAMNK